MPRLILLLLGKEWSRKWVRSEAFFSITQSLTAYDLTLHLKNVDNIRPMYLTKVLFVFCWGKKSQIRPWVGKDFINEIRYVNSMYDNFCLDLSATYGNVLCAVATCLMLLTGWCLMPGSPWGDLEPLSATGCQEIGQLSWVIVSSDSCSLQSP